MIKWAKCISSVNRGINMMNTIQIKVKEISVPNLNGIKNECNVKLEEVKNYILEGTDKLIKETNLTIIQEAYDEIQKMFQEMHSYMNFTGVHNVKMVLESISERLELVELMNEDEEMKMEAYFDVLLDLPVSVNQILNLKMFVAIDEILNAKANINDGSRLVNTVPKSFKDKIEVECTVTARTSLKDNYSPKWTIFYCEEEMLVQVA